MNILFLQGPNLNLLGIKSSELQKRETLGKLNKHIKKESHSLNIKLKTLQTHKEFQSINFLQRNRIWANGLIIIPTSWGKTNYTILETINLINIKTAAIYFNSEYSFGTSFEESIIKSKHIKSFTGSPFQICSEALKYIIS